MGDTPRILETMDVLRHELLSFEPGLYTGSDCARLAQELAVTEKACAAARLLASARAVACGAHKEAGVADPARWVARQGGTTTRQAKDALATAASLEACPATKDALLAGEVSILQASEITKAVDEMPDAEAALLEVARAGDLTTLRDEARERRLTAIPVDVLHSRQVAARHFRHWRDRIGMVCFEGALPPETGVPFVTRVEREGQRRFREAKGRDVASEPFERHAADALVALTAGGTDAPASPRTELVLVCDIYAWRRGHAHPGEPCHVIGGGPIPVDVAKELSEDAFLKVVLHDGVTIGNVRHFGRHLKAELKTALDLGPIPTFSGRACTDCGRHGYGLEYDHENPVANHGPTCYDNVNSRCYPCHQEKTEQDRKAGLLGSKARSRDPGTPAKGPSPPKKPGRPTKKTAGHRELARRAPPARDPP